MNSILMDSVILLQFSFLSSLRDVLKCSDFFIPEVFYLRDIFCGSELEKIPSF